MVQVSTDALARGVCFGGLDHQPHVVINYDVPPGR